MHPSAADCPPAPPPAPAAVSVVIPAFNYAHFLPTAMASVLGQTWPHLELILVDDGSTDQTPAVAAAQTDPRFRYVRQENAGLSAARNTGIGAARYPFVAFLDADDLWHPHFLERVMGAFAEREERFAMVASQTVRMDPEGRVTQHRHGNPEPDRELTIRDFLIRNRPLSSSVVIRKAAFEKCGLFDTSLRSSEDRDMWIRLTRHYRAWFIGQPLGQVRRHPANMSKNAVRMKRNSFSVLKKALQNGVVSRTEAGLWLRAFSVHYFQSAWTHFDEGKRGHALGYLTLSGLLWPLYLRPGRFSERPLFRLRALAHFLLRRP